MAERVRPCRPVPLSLYTASLSDLALALPRPAEGAPPRPTRAAGQDRPRSDHTGRVIVLHMSLFPDVVVNGETIPPATIVAVARNHSAPKDMPGIAWRKAVQVLAIRARLLQEARIHGLIGDPEEP